jgi:sortase (surface protein transpeptidase)
VAAAISVAAAIGVIGVASAALSGPSGHTVHGSAGRSTLAAGAPPADKDVASPVTTVPVTTVPAAQRSASKTKKAVPKKAAPTPQVNLSGLPTSGPAVPAPTAITIPSLGVHTSLIKLGQNANGTAEVPATTNVAGWYDKGPAPGQRGPAVILGHVDSIEGPGVFFKIDQLPAGAVIQIAEGGHTLSFTVQSTSVYLKTAFPTAAVFGSTPARALRLVTCGGPFDYSTGHYLDNVVVFATET